MLNLSGERAERKFTEELWPQATNEVSKFLWQQHGQPGYYTGWETRRGAQERIHESQRTPEETRAFLIDTANAKDNGVNIYRFLHIREKSLHDPESMAFLRFGFQFAAEHFTTNEQLRVFTDVQTRDWEVELPEPDYTLFDNAVHVRTHFDSTSREILHREFFYSDNPDDHTAIQEAVSLREQLFSRIAEMPLIRQPEPGQLCFDGIAHYFDLKIPTQFQ